MSRIEMECDEDSLPTMNSPAATTRSPEDEDLLQRSTKKTKRPRDPTEKSNRVQPAEIGQDSTTFAGLKSPDSTRWQTPVETPNTAWGRKNCGGEGSKDEEIRNQQPPEETQAEGQQARRTQPAPQPTAPTRNYKDNFGAWMLVTKKDRRGQRRPDNRPPGPPGRGRNQNATLNPNPRAMATSSRFAALEQLADYEIDPTHEGTMPATNIMNTTRSLPGIRTTPHTQTQFVPVM
nr:uncharacterized protein LOC109156274 [Ipomoea batatas]